MFAKMFESFASNFFRVGVVAEMDRESANFIPDENISSQMIAFRPR
jgi:hypothetical protein